MAADFADGREIKFKNFSIRAVLSGEEEFFSEFVDENMTELIALVIIISFIQWVGMH